MCVLIITFTPTTLLIWRPRLQACNFFYVTCGPDGFRFCIQITCSISVSIVWLLHWQDDFEQDPKLRQSNGRAFFSPPDFQVPEKEMGQHAGYDVVAPSWKLTHFVVVHASSVLFPESTGSIAHLKTAEPYKCL